MESYQTENLKTNLPKSWAEINLDTFKKISKVLPDFKAETELETQISTCMKIFSLLGRNDINSMDSEDFGKAIEDIAWIFNLPEELIIKQVEIGAEIYAFNDKNFWTPIEFIQLNEFLKGKTQEEVIDNLEYLLAIFLRPTEQKVEKKERVKTFKLFSKQFQLKRKRYEVVNSVKILDVNDLEARAKIFNECLPADVAYNLYVFFCLFTIEYSMSIQSSLIQEALESITK